ncbi:COX15/CtaA family protein [Chryseotalea sanaruensis]|nr:COX15/CtaA family protein [Chryseotalea sanaruensis]
MRFFRKLTLLTLIAVYLLIMVGGIVRSTGSGMGCPDWPKCFGSWVPPITVEQLPENYKEVYAAHREKKNVRFANYLKKLGMEETAIKILNDKSILQEADFNVTKTWVEYINRVIGVIIGLLIFAVFVASIRFWSWDKKITIIGFATFFLVGIQGWIGSFVVSTNLTPWTVTVHMLLALVIVALLVYLYFESTKDKQIRKVPYGLSLLVLCMTLLVMQIVLGTQVREAIDVAASSLLPRSSWIEASWASFVIHRTFSWLIVIAHVVLLWKLLKSEGSKILPYSLAVLILATILSGVGMAYFDIPAFLQPVHLTVASITVGLQFLLALQLNSGRGEMLINQHVSARST